MLIKMFLYTKKIPGNLLKFIVRGNYLIKVNLRHRLKVSFSTKKYFYLQSSHDIKQFGKRSANFEESTRGGVNSVLIRCTEQSACKLTKTKNSVSENFQNSFTTEMRRQLLLT